jgi:hypothetical protein
MSNFISIQASVCCDEEVVQFVVDDRTSAITTGNTYYFTVGDKRYCATVDVTSKGESRATATFTGDYTSCEECLSGITTAVKVSECVGKGGLSSIYFVDIATFTTLPSFGEVYYMTITLDGDSITNCFTIDCFVTPRDGEKILSLTSISDSHTGCTECLLNNIQTYEVTPCLTSSIPTYYVNLPLGFDYTNYIINFTDESGNSICGTVQGITVAETNGTLISILGSKDDVSCEDCLAISSEKRIITNCLTGGTEVVWGSTFYGGAEVTNLSTADGCFEVGDLTESEVTINTFLDYNPQPDCQECIQCNGVVYSYSSCTGTGPILSITYDDGGGTSLLPDATYGAFTGVTNGGGIGSTFLITIASGAISNVSAAATGILYNIGDTITIDKDNFSGDTDLIITVTDVTTTGGFFSLQYVQTPIGKTVYLPFLDDCVEITGVSTDGSYQYTMYSFDVFDDCSLCESNDFYVWKTRDCATDISYIVTVSSNSFTTGDYVKVKWGTTDFQCHELLSPYDFVTDGFLTPYKSETLTPFDDCETCNSGTLIGASIVKCGGGGQQFVNIPITIWNTMSGFFDSQLVFVTDKYGQCYILLNNCPLEPNYNTITPVSTYYNCIQCVFDNTRFPRSANTETLICVVCCDCGSSGSTITQVAPPHPVYTDQYGTDVTQMNMVVLGGPKGLNN